MGECRNIDVMSPSRSPPFIDRESGELDFGQIRAEAFPVAGLIALFTGLALVPLVPVVLAIGNSLLGALLVLVAQFVLAVGAGVVLIYVVARGVQLAET